MLDPTIPLKTLTPGDIQAQQQDAQLKSMQLQTGKQNLQKGQLGLQSDQLDMYMKKNESMIQLLQGVTDQTSYDRAKQTAASMGLPVDHVPQQYDPNTVKQMTNSALSVKDRLQIEALTAYRGAQIGLKRDQVNKGIGGWNPITESWDTGDASGGQPLPVPALGGQPFPTAATIPIPAAPIGGAATVPPALPTAQQDPVQASKDAIAAQQQVTGVSPAQRPDLSSLPAAQVASMPINQAQPSAPVQAMASQPASMAQRIGETTQQYRMRLQSQGIGSTSPVIYAANRIMQDAAKAGKPVPYETALSIAKKGLGEGQTFDVNTGQVGNIAGATQATGDMALAKGEGSISGHNFGEQMDQYRTAAQAAQGMDATLNAMKTDAEKFRMGAMSDMQGAAKGYLQAIAQGLGVPTPEMDKSLGAQQAFTKSAMGLVMGGMQKVQGRAFGEMKAIQSAFPTQAMSKDGFDLVTSQIAGTNQYSEAMYQAANEYKQKNGSLSGFENGFQKNVSPWAYVVKNMNQSQLSDLRDSLGKTPEGQKELHMLADQIDYATKSGYMQ